MRFRDSISCAVLLVALQCVSSPSIAREPESKSTEYQRKLEVLDVRAQALAKKRYFEAWGGAKLTSEEAAEWHSVTGELHEINPYWRFRRQLVEDIAAITEAPPADGVLWRKVEGRYLEFLKIVGEKHPASTQEQAQAEVFRLRHAFITADLKAARHLAKLNAARVH